MSHDAGQIAAEIPAKSRRKSAGKLPETKRTPPAGDDAQELGTSGTENMMGIISGAEYLPALVPPHGLKVYDQMRRSSAQVKASLWIVKTPILSSTPVVQAVDKSDPVNVGIADFCQAALFGPGAKMAVKWREVFEHLMTRLEFGVSVSEKVWRFDRPSSTWRIHKIAPRLATTLSGWKMAPGTSDLAFVEQQAFRPGGSFDPILMPTSKCLISTYQREGDNFWGTSILRGSYMHWFYLMELYRIDMVRADRYGAGIPKAKFTTADAWNNTKVVSQVKRALRALRSHERAYLLEHPEVDFSVMVPGSDGGARIKESIDHHAQMIVQNVLASFLSSQSDGMSTNRTFTLSDIFSSVIEMVAAEVAEDLTDQVIRELCDLNFVMEGRPYPKVVFTNIAHDDLEALTTQLTRLSAVGAYTATPEDEAHFRNMYKLPERKEPIDTPEPEATEPDPDDEEGDEEPTPDDDKARARVLAARRKDEPLLGRAPTPLERVLLRDPSRRATRLNQISTRLETRLTAVRRLQLDQLVAAIVAKDARATTAAFTDLRPDEFRIPEAKLTEKAITDVQKEAFAYGRATVRQELVRQGARLSVRARAVEEDCRILAAGSSAKKPQPARPDTAAAARSALLTSAKVTAELLNDIWFGRVLETAVRIRRGGATGKELAKGVWNALESELSGGLWGKAKAEVNEALGLGRGIEARIHGDEIDTVVQSAIFDVNLCDECEKVDGEEMEYGSDRMYELMPPYSRCEGNKGGGDACRCEQLYLLKDRTV